MTIKLLEFKGNHIIQHLSAVLIYFAYIEKRLLYYCTGNNLEYLCYNSEHHGCLNLKIYSQEPRINTKFAQRRVRNWLKDTKILDYFCELWKAILAKLIRMR